MNNTQTIFIHKYKPTKIDDFAMSDDSNKLLNNMVCSDKLNLLFVGESGVGKTSMINVIIDQYYANYPKTKYIDDILYITPLKDQGIHYYRNDVKLFCQASSNIKGKKKIIVLDDIDYMNDQNQQIFKNCIEKYSQHVQFIITCVNLQRVIDGIQSRFLIWNINKPTHHNISSIVKKIKDHEEIELTDDAEKFVIQVSTNNIQTVIHYMEKFKLYGGPITYDTAVDMCTNINYSIFDNFIQALKSDKLFDAIQIMKNISTKGYSVMDILDSFFSFVKITTLMTDIEKYEATPILCKYVTIFHNLNEEDIELALFANDMYKMFCSINGDVAFF